MKSIVIFLLVVLLGCQLKPSDKDLQKHMVVQTTFNENTAFSFYSSFTLSLDTVGLLSNISKDTLVLGSLATQITNSVQSNMSTKGYTYLDKMSNPDLGFASYIVQNYNVTQQVNYPRYYNSYYGYGYGGYYGSPYVSTYISSKTTLVVNLIDLKNRNSENRLIVIWSAFIGDIEKSDNRNVRILEALDQAFDQSPYFHKP